MSRPKGSKNKSKAAFDTKKINARMKELEWVGKVEGWCKVKGFPPSELIEIFEELEKRITLVVEQKQEVTEAYGAHLEECQNKLSKAPQNGIFTPDSPYGPDTAPEIGKSGKTTQKEEKGKEGAENGSETKDKDAMPAGLSKADTLKWHRNHK